ncbi:MAG: lactate racemase domain-containing protein [Bacillota bacterium]|jgi:hypothetical protein
MSWKKQKGEIIVPIVEGGFDIDLPKMVEIRQKFVSDKITDIPAKVYEELNKPEIKARFKPGQRIAITVGSRGIANIALITKTCIDWLKENGMEPFVVPAMGSHGGGTPEGQLEVLASYNVTEETMGVKIDASMDVVELGQTESGTPVYVSKPAYEADGIMVVARIKPHTNFRGPIESGLMKMMVIGLGKHRGATYVHQQGFALFNEIIPEVGRAIVERAPIACGVGIVENGYDETMIIRAVTPDKIEETDVELLPVARDAMPKILFDEMDLLIVDEIGKNISGSGMDPNVTGRFTSSNLIKQTFKPYVKKLFVRGLTEETHGNATGIGDADLTTRRVVEKIDWEYTYANVITSTELMAGGTPMTMENDRQAIVVALKTVPRVEPTEAKVVRIRNTAELDEIWISESLLPEAKANPNIEVLGELKPMEFDSEDFLK